MGALIRTYDWSLTSLGPPEMWPRSLRIALGIIINSQFPMYLFWGEDSIQFYNDAYRIRMPDSMHPFALGKSARECWPDRWHMLEPLIRQVMERGESNWNEDHLFYEMRNGVEQEVYWTYSYSPIKNEDGKVAGIFVACTETTDKVKSIRELGASEDQLRFAIDAAELGTWDLDPRSGIFRTNARMKEWCGVDPWVDMPMHTALDVIAAHDRMRVTAAIERAMLYESGGQFEIEYSIIHPYTQAERILRAKGRTWFNDNRVAVRFNGVLQDVTQAALDRRRIEESEARLRSLVEETAFATAVLEGPGLVMTLANEALLGVWDNDRSVIGKPIRELMSLPADQTFMDHLSHVYATGRSYSCLEGALHFRVNGREDQERFLDYHLKALYDARGEVEGILFTGADVTEKVHARKKLMESEQQVRALIEAAPFPIGVYIGKEMQIQFANRSLLDIWAKGTGVIGRRFSDILPELSNQQVFEQFDRVFESGEPFSTTNQPIELIVGGKPKVYYFNYNLTPLHDAQGKVYGIMSTAADVTDLNLAKLRIEESEERFRTMVQQAPVAIGLTRGRDMVFESINAPMMEIIGVQDDVVGRPLSAVLPELEGQAVLNILYEAFDTGKPFAGYEILTFLKNQGEEGNVEPRYFNISYTPIFEFGEVVALVHVAVEVTAQVKAREKVQAAEEVVRNTAERLEMAIEAGNFGSFESIFATGEIICTATCKRNVGLQPEDSLTYDRLLSIIVPEDRPGVGENVQKAIRDRVPYNVEHRVKWPDGSIRWIRTSGRPVFDEEGQPVKLVGITADITEQKLFAEELSRQVQERTLALHRSNEDLLQFAHVTSHDLKEPVRKIKLFSKRLRDEHGKALPASGQAFLEKIQTATDRMLSMIEGVLTYSALNSAQVNVDAIDLNAIVSNIETDLEVMIQRQNAVIHKGALPQIEGAAILIHQLFYNIINNALKFLKKDEPGRIHIDSRLIEQGQYAEITVSDNGIGFDNEFSQKIFDNFTRLNSKDKYEGTGLGLALCKKIVDRHRGRIFATSVVNKGSVFTIILPLWQKDSSI